MSLGFSKLDSVFLYLRLLALYASQLSDKQYPLKAWGNLGWGLVGETLKPTEPMTAGRVSLYPLSPLKGKLGEVTSQVEFTGEVSNF